MLHVLSRDLYLSVAHSIMLSFRSNRFEKMMIQASKPRNTRNETALHYYISRATPANLPDNAEGMRTGIRSFHISRTSREIWHWRACCRHILEFVTIRHVFMPRTLHKTHQVFLNVLVIKPTFNIGIYKWWYNETILILEWSEISLRKEYFAYRKLIDEKRGNIFKKLLLLNERSKSYERDG